MGDLLTERGFGKEIGEIERMESLVPPQACQVTNPGTLAT